MTETEILAAALYRFAGLTAEDFALSLPHWQYKTYKKGEYYNQYRTVCRYLGFTLEGVFRSYIVNDKSGEERNVFLYSSNQFVVTFKSFINQLPCDYYTQAMTDAKVIYISLDNLLQLYRQSHKWESFGRRLAEEAFNVAIARAESFVIRNPEERYIDLLQQHPGIFDTVPLYHISSYLGIQGPSLSRIRKRLSGK